MESQSSVRQTIDYVFEPLRDILSILYLVVIRRKLRDRVDIGSLLSVL